MDTRQQGATIMEDKYTMVRQITTDLEVCNALECLGWKPPKAMEDLPNEINVLHSRIFDLEIGLSEMINQNTDLNEMLKKEMESNHVRIKKIAELMKQLGTTNCCDNDIYKAMTNQ